MPEMERIMRRIEKEAETLPNRQFVLTPTSGTPQMRDAIIRLLSNGLLPGAQAYEVLDPTHVPNGIRIRSIDLPPPDRRRQKVALFVDHENIRPAYPEAFAERVQQIANEWGDVEVACVGACEWDSLEVQQAYARAGFLVHTFVSGEKGGQVADYGLLRIIAQTIEHRPDIALYIIASEDTDFAHALIPALEQGKKVFYLRRTSSWQLAPEWRELSRTYPANVRIESIEVGRRHLRQRTAQLMGKPEKRKQAKPSPGRHQTSSTTPRIQDPTGELQAGHTRIGTIVHEGPGQIMVDINGTRIDLPRSEQVETDQYEEGQQITVYVLQTTGADGGSKFLASRRNPSLLRGVLELTVPEVREGIVQIKAVRRRPGSSSEIAVATTTREINPVACCVRRIRLIVKILNSRNEKIWITEWNPDLSPRDESGTLAWPPS
jgi:hypothetical protein